MKKFNFNNINSKNKIAHKLASYIGLSLIVFALILSCIFVFVFSNNITQNSKLELEKRAEKIATSFTEYLVSENSINNNHSGMMMGQMHNGMMGFGAYLRFIDDIAMTDVWVIDKNLEFIIASNNTSQNLDYSDLPKNAGTIIDLVYQNKNAISKTFGSFGTTRSVTTGAPIFDQAGLVYGVVLLQSQVDDAALAVQNGVLILIFSSVIAFFVSQIFAYSLSVKFTTPLRKINTAANKLASGDFNAKTLVFQNDEIGELASTVDILAQKLSISSKESEKLEQTRQDFLSNVSHELRTPVTVIRGSLEALCDGIVTQESEVESYHKQMLSESILLERLVCDLLDLSKLQNTDFVFEMQTLDLTQIIQDVTRATRRISSPKNISISLNINKNFKNIFIGDYGRLRQMFLIVAGNAIKFSKENSIININLENNFVFIQDFGSGIQEKDLPHIFERFYKSNAKINDSGTGLGLAIAKNIADRHKIKILVNSTINSGTKFCFEFI